ncbi:MAG: DUF4157 domain-containing protein [Candidatus Omnitrophica bacterium]|nr:DUF4157 domain-containing protein [Candidatus Omnitrophota bacterium]
MGEKVQVAVKKPEVKRENLTSKSRNADKALSMSSPADRILYFQRTIGNQAVQRLIKSGTLQANLRIGQPGDKYEQEADRVADAVIRMPEPGVQQQVEPEEEETLQSKPLVNQITPLVQVQRQEEPEEEEETLQAKPLAEEITPFIQRQVEPEEEEEEELQAKATSGRISVVNSNLESHIQSFKGGGQPLPENDRAFFEPRFGRNFSQVRVHTGKGAAETAKSINARAFTVGRNIAFGAGEYSQETTLGRKLLAHELMHVVQQTTSTMSTSELQRAPDKKRKRWDVVVLGEGWEGGEELSGVLAKGGLIIRVKSVEETVVELAKIDFPIGTLYFVTHSTASGGLRFGNEEGFIEPADIADKLKNAVSADSAPYIVDFRGCSVGTSPKAMNQIRAALRARSVVAGNCFAVIARSTPIKIGDKPITKTSDITGVNRAQFKKLMKDTADNFGEKKKCILNRSKKDFLAAGGRFVLLWFNHDFTGKWLKDKSVCYKDITPETVDPDKAMSQSQDCRLIKVEVDTKSHGESGHREGGRTIPPP